MSLPMDRTIDWLFSKVVMDRGSVYVIAWLEYNLGSAGGTLLNCTLLAVVHYYKFFVPFLYSLLNSILLVGTFSFDVGLLI